MAEGSDTDLETSPEDSCRMFVGTGVSANGKILGAHICYECVSMLMAVIAQMDRVWFEEQVEKARIFQPPDPGNK